MNNLSPKSTTYPLKCGVTDTLLGCKDRVGSNEGYAASLLARGTERKS